MRYLVFLIQCVIVILVAGYLNEAHWEDTGKFVTGYALMIGFGVAYVLTVGLFKMLDLFGWLGRALSRNKPRRQDSGTLVLRPDQQDLPQIGDVARKRLR